MKLLSWLRSLAATLLRRSQVELDLDEELRSHIQHRADDLERCGLPHEDALRRAKIEFGGREKFKEECRESLGAHLWDTLRQDILYGLRTLRKSPGFTSIAVLTLALGIGANTAIFSAVYGILLRPLPYQDPDRLVVLQETTPRVGTVSASYPNFRDWRAQSRSFSAMAAVLSVRFSLSGVQPEYVRGHAVSPNFLSVLGVRPFLGRDFNASEENPGAAPVALLSYPFWRSRFGGDPAAIGSTISLNDRAFTIIGVLQPDYRTIEKTDFIMPIGVWATNNPAVAERGDRGDLVVLARLTSSTNLQEARAEMEGIAARIAEQYPATNDQFGVSLQPVRDVFVGDMRAPILVLCAAVMFVLLIACANVANLCLVRGAARNHEIAVRMALGAVRARIIRQILTENFLLATLGGILGVALALAGVGGMARAVPANMLAEATVDLNGPVLMFSALTVVLSALMFGLVPAMQAAKLDPHPAVKEDARTTSAAGGQGRLRDILAIAEISIALVLLVGAGLMVRSLIRLLSVDPGFSTDGVLTMNLDLRAAKYAKDQDMLNFWRQLLDQVHALPAVERAAVATVVPLTDDHSRSDITIENMALPKPGDFPHPDVHIVSSEYFSALGIPVLRGRAFTESDRENAPLVGMISAAVQSRYFSNDDPVGKRFIFGHPKGKNNWITIIGVAGNTKLYGLANPARLEIYVPFLQSPTDEMELIVKSAGDPTMLSSAVYHAVGSIDKDQPIDSVATMKQLVSDSVLLRRVTLVALGLFSVLALVLAAVGVYGVISYAVSLRTREIGIRLALGAQRGDVLRLVGRQGVRLALVGIFFGGVASLGLTHLMSTLLFAVSATDPLTFGGVALVLAIVALAASYIPARRAMRIDPTVALRHE